MWNHLPTNVGRRAGRGARQRVVSTLTEMSKSSHRSPRNSRTSANGLMNGFRFDPRPDADAMLPDSMIPGEMYVSGKMLKQHRKQPLGRAVLQSFMSHRPVMSTTRKAEPERRFGRGGPLGETEEAAMFHTATHLNTSTEVDFGDPTTDTTSEAGGASSNHSYNYTFQPGRYSELSHSHPDFLAPSGGVGPKQHIFDALIQHAIVRYTSHNTHGTSFIKRANQTVYRSPYKEDTFSANNFGGQSSSSNDQSSPFTGSLSSPEVLSLLKIVTKEAYDEWKAQLVSEDDEDEARSLGRPPPKTFDPRDYGAVELLPLLRNCKYLVSHRGRWEFSRQFQSEASIPLNASASYQQKYGSDASSSASAGEQAQAPGSDEDEVELGSVGGNIHQSYHRAFDDFKERNRLMQKAAERNARSSTYTAGRPWDAFQSNNSGNYGINGHGNGRTAGGDNDYRTTTGSHHGASTSINEPVVGLRPYQHQAPPAQDGVRSMPPRNCILRWT